MASNNDPQGSILDQIKEQTTNVEQIITSNNVQGTLVGALEEMAQHERVTRESTISIKMSEALSHDKITELIEKEWTSARQQAPATFWKDKENTYAQFMNKATKQVFIQFAGAKEVLKDLHAAIIPPDSEGVHLKRKDVRIVMASVPEAVSTEKVDATLKNMSTTKTRIGQIRAGKPYGQIRKMRSLMTGVNAEGFKLIFKEIGGAIPYNDNDKKIKIRLYPKIACKPWACRDCYYIGPNHNCQGKACTQCGNKGHQGKDCRTKTRYCTNCRKPGHRAKDSHCPIFVREIIKELKRMDIPLEYLESKTLRNQLIKMLSFK
ncbi:zf-CCHC domain-containing [Olea europaea subsp. europaea]|uniref:Zf-CCHC domain-containing, partial n=1 Tax=Olea europaea subsp. europaea TaxID=158383 RepID=A0A8S0TH77_OLEEU|nr:zf-CCHC domain-containing [Olea europaea subsp. europaea]